MVGNEKPRIFIARVIPEVGMSQLLESCQADVWRDSLPPPRHVLLQRVAGCEGVLTLLTEKVDAEFLDAAGPQLKAVSNYAVGIDNIDVAEATRRGVRVGNTPGVLTEATADLAFALLISAARRLVEAQRYVLDGQWKTWEPMGHIGLDLNGKTLGIVGLGRIGYSMARKCHRGWDMRVLYTDVQSNADAERALQAKRVDFDTLLAESDFVSVHCSLNESTAGLFNAEVFRKMKTTAVFINTARGPLHNQRDLYEALRVGEIFAAGLDVSDPEPIPLDDPLLTLPNCIVLPHIASATVDSRNGMAAIAAENLLAGLRGDPLRAWVNPESARIEKSE